MFRRLNLRRIKLDIKNKSKNKKLTVDNIK